MARGLESARRSKFVGMMLGAVAVLVTLARPAVASIDNTLMPEVNTNNGGFSTSIPIEVPAFHGLDPHLSLRYDSTRLNGFVGVGWSLDGLSSIESHTSGRGMAVYGPWNRFYLDGERMNTCTVLGGTH